MTISVKDASGSTQTIKTLDDVSNNNGQATMAASSPVVLASDYVLSKALTGYYITCPVNTATTLQSGTGATGDYLAGVIIVPGSTSPTSVTLKDSSGGSAITLFAGGASSVSNLVPFFIPVGAFSRAGAWIVTTGATNVTAIAVGKFS